MPILGPCTLKPWSWLVVVTHSLSKMSMAMAFVAPRPGLFSVDIRWQRAGVGWRIGTSVSLDFCLEAPEIPGCTDPAALNYNPLTVDDGSCTEGTPGCTDALACNFNATANVDDGSCSFPEQYYNCEGECNLDSDGDGVCEELEVEGCQDETACNFDGLATDPGACFYPDPGFNCDGTSLCTEDLNDNNAVEVGDVLLVLADFGCTVNCAADITGDGL